MYLTFQDFMGCFASLVGDPMWVQEPLCSGSLQQGHSQRPPDRGDGTRTEQRWVSKGVQCLRAHTCCVEDHRMAGHDLTEATRQAVLHRKDVLCRIMSFPFTHWTFVCFRVTIFYHFFKSHQIPLRVAFLVAIYKKFDLYEYSIA